MIISWRIYRLDDDANDYYVFAHDRDAAIRCARLEHFGLVLQRSMLGCGRA